MSYDLTIFTRSDPSRALANLGLEPAGDTLVVRLPGAQVVFWPANLVEEEDVPPRVLQGTPDVRFSVEVNIEGRSSVRLLRRARELAQKIVDTCGGVVVDRQRDDEGVPPAIETGFNQKEETLSLSWWFTGADEFAATGYLQVVDLLAKDFPEALPRSYGLWEPPQFKLELHGLDHFREFLRQNVRDMVVWYPSRPCLDVFASVPPRVGPSRQGYRCCRVSLTVKAKMRERPKGAILLKALWLDISSIVTPFYAEIRFGETPTVSWWWNGVPSQLGMAALIGPPYLELWPSFSGGANSTSAGLRYLEQVETGECLQIHPPPSIAMPEPTKQPAALTGPELLAFLASDRRSYPETWPFESPFQHS